MVGDKFFDKTLEFGVGVLDSACVLCGEHDVFDRFHLCGGSGEAALGEVGFDGVFSLETLPSAALDDKSFEAECIRLFNIAKSIIESSRL